jgi:secreted trypsin-like serine protease
MSRVNENYMIIFLSYDCKIYRDSGGPMTTITSKNRPDKLIGIVSFGEECADPNYPGVYSRISSVRQWITYYTGI